MKKERCKYLFWYFIVIMTLLIIGNVEKNPGPRKKRQSITKRYKRESHASLQCASRKIKRNNKNLHPKKNDDYHETDGYENIKRKRCNSIDPCNEAKKTKLEAEIIDEENNSRLHILNGTIESQIEWNKIRKQNQRKRLSNEDKETIKRHETLNRKMARSKQPKADKSAICLRETESRMKRRARLDDDQRTEIQKKDIQRKQKQRCSVDPENSGKIKSQETISRQKQRMNLDGRTKIEIKERETAGRRQLRLNLDEKTKSKIQLRETSSRKNIRRYLDDEIKREIQAQDTSRRRNSRGNLNEKTKSVIRTRETAGRKTTRYNLDDTTKSVIRTRETAGRKTTRCKLDDKTKSVIRTRETAGRKTTRCNLDDKTKSVIRTRETAGRKTTRCKLDDKTKSVIRTRETAGRKTTRCKLDEKAKSVIRIRETVDRKNTRCNLDHDSKAKIHKVDREAKVVSRKKTKENRQSIPYIKLKFETAIKEGPTFVCTSCNRQLYRKTVVHFHCNRYKEESQNLVDNCRTKILSYDENEYICHTCDKYLKSNKIPLQAVCNNLNLDAIPDELTGLCSLEERLVSKRLPFMQIVNLPRGGQKGIRGCVVNVPANMQKITDMLPRIPSDCGFVPVKLKRQLKYKGHSMYQSIRPDYVLEALQCLRSINLYYKDIKVDDNWIERSKKDNEEIYNLLFEDESDWNFSEDSEDISGDTNHKENENKTIKNIEEIEEDMENKLKGLPYNTCLQPANDPKTTHNQDIFNIAPGEGQIPLDMILDKNSETLAFPREFPSGRFGLNDTERKIKINPKRYFNQRILNKDPRFATNIEYLFYAQYYTEVKQIRDNISIAMRKGSINNHGNTAGLLKNAENIQNLMKQNEGFRFLQSVRGSYPYWHKTLLDLFAMVRQLDIPTFFCTFSAADMRWPETIQIIGRQYGRNFSDKDVENMNWQDRCYWLRNNPVTAARHFEFRANKFFIEVLKSEALPIGEIADMFWRVEFQQRGSPHLHCLFWIKNAPKIEKENESEVCQFIDKYISCELPEDEELNKLVSSLQRHTHSSSCKKNQQGCRFHFPRPPSNETMIGDKVDDENPSVKSNRRAVNITILSYVLEVLQENPNLTFEELMIKAKIPEDSYQKALRESVTKKTVFLKRKPSECDINNYNPALLSIWKANLDIQFVTDPWACVMYILSYISKGEREMGLLLKEACKDSEENEDIRKQMKKLGNVFLTHREVSSQEAVYRILSMPLKKSSREVVFINTSIPSERVHILKSKEQLEKLEDDSDDVFQKGIVERYMARPKELENMKLVDFATSYRANFGSCDDENILDSDNEEKVTNESIKLLNNMGIMKKRHKRAIARTPRFSKCKFPEKFYHSILMMYLPWRDEEKDLLGSCEKYEDHFMSREAEILKIMEEYEKESGLLDIALQILQSEESISSDLWNDLASTVQQEDMDCMKEKLNVNVLGLNDPSELNGIFCGVPELGMDEDNTYTVEKQREVLNNEEYRKVVRSLNEDQRQIFDVILRWCRAVLQSQKHNENVESFCIFLTGGAGTGKSHVIKAIVNMARRELQPLCDENPESAVVLLMAPTGCAAKNIGGSTIHSCLSIPVDSRKNDHLLPLSANKLATMRFCLQHLKLIIIDEISMVGCSLLNKIHLRLQEIMGITNADTYFGGLSVLAVGDFYQLQPVGNPYVFGQSTNLLSKLSFHIWKDLFKIAEVEKIMRQKSDIDFANLLNRVRKGSPEKEDIELLKSRIIRQDDKNYPLNALHVFPCNKQVDEHNMKMLELLNQPILYLHAKGSEKDLSTGRVKVKMESKSKEDNMSDILAVAVGARVMLIRNIDIKDSLVNGVMGTVTGFACDGSEVNSILVKFDDALVGQQKRKLRGSTFHGSTPIEREQVSFGIGKYHSIEQMKTQFPLKLAFGCTIHKTQGITLDEIVLSFDGSYRPGQAYVGLSRCKNSNGLYLTSFDENKIKKSNQVETEMQRMRKEMPLQKYVSCEDYEANQYLKICHLNIKSLKCHLNDLKQDNGMMSSDVICISESWLSIKDKDEVVKLPGYTMFRRDRRQCYLNHDCIEGLKVCSKCNDKGGVVVYVRESIKVQRRPDLDTNGSETLSVQLQDENIGNVVIISVYRPEHVSLSAFNNKINESLQKCKLEKTVCVITGDFNKDFTKNENSCIIQNLTSKNFHQLIRRPTHINGSILDHMYINKIIENTSGTMCTYYSDHDAIYCCIPKLDSNTQMPSEKRLCQKVETIKTETKKETMKKDTKNVKIKFHHKVVSETVKTRGNSEKKCSSQKLNEKDDDIQIENIDLSALHINEFESISYEKKQQVAQQMRVKIRADGIVNPLLYDYRYKNILMKLQHETPSATLDAMEADGNCYFRGISKELFGSENYHKKIRIEICNFLETHQFTFGDWLDIDEFKRHIDTMKKNRTWATELEILGTATLFNTSIYIFTESYIENHNHRWKWIKFSPLHIHENDPDGSIPVDGCFYLHHTWGNHYDRVVSMN